MLKHTDSKKLVYPAAEYHKYLEIPKDWQDVFGDGNYSAAISGATGSGKDNTTQYLVCVDLAHNRTPIILDLKMEYSFAIFCQNDTILANLLRKQGLAGRGFKVNLWVPYIEGLDENEHFKYLCENHHPNLRVRPFRILKSSLISEDTYNLSLQKSYVQTIVTEDKKGALNKQLRALNAIKEEMARKRLAIDTDNLWEQGCGWEYMDFQELTTNKEINVISTYFMLGQNTISVISFNVALINELMTFGKRTHQRPGDENTFSVVIPELQYFLLKIKANKEVAETLMASLLGSLLLMRSFDSRVRFNLQNLSAMYDDMFSQSRIFMSKTINPRDLTKLRVFGFKTEERELFRHLPIGDFIDISNKRRFNVVPFFHKAQQRQHISKALESYRENPAGYLFEGPSCLLSEVVNYDKLGLDWPCTVHTYNKAMKHWISRQEALQLKAMEYEKTSDFDDIAESFRRPARA